MIPLGLFPTVFILYTVHEAVARFPRGGQLVRRHWLWLVRRLDVILPPQLIPGPGAKLDITRRLVKNWQSWRFTWCEAFLQASKTTTARVAAACWSRNGHPDWSWASCGVGGPDTQAAEVAAFCTHVRVSSVEKWNETKRGRTFDLYHCLINGGLV